ncbi:MAG: hypothetical protein JXA96_01515 [Sedimentisphaerales bacterium]|nr:hypothetical protein [Sedimentisphaerales bacterium]
MSQMISNIVFTKNRPLQLDAYLESLYKYFPADLIHTYIIYKEELFSEEYNKLFQKYNKCVVIKESDFFTDFMDVLNQVDTKYILFGIDDVVFYDSVDMELINKTFDEQSDNIYGFTLRFSTESLKDSGDKIEEISTGEEKVFRLNWKEGQTPHTRYPFELCCTFYKTELVKRIIYSSMNLNPFLKKIFGTTSFLTKLIAPTGLHRKVFKRFGYIYSPNKLESWPCRWSKNNKAKVPDYIYFQKLCASAIQVNMVNTTTKNDHDGTQEHTVEALNDKYKQNFRLDIEFVSNNKPTEPGCGREYFKLKNK